MIDELTRALVYRINLQERLVKNRAINYTWLVGQLEHMLRNNGLHIRYLETHN